ncbi:MAG: ATP-binding protein, partial [Deltaproteobacteria bacterium]
MIITGMRRCGKSVLLDRVRRSSLESDCYFNFEDERLVNFTAQDFQVLLETFIELFGHQKTFFFDEIQNINGWEMFLRRLYNSGNKILVTGSNASLFSQEMGTKLTGRHIPITVLPFSFAEYASFNGNLKSTNVSMSTVQKGAIKKLYGEYSRLGGIPGYVKYQKKEYLHSLCEGIIYRDIVARYNISNAEVLKKLAFYLASSCGKEVTYSSLRKLLGIGSATTVSDYCNHIEKSFLCFFLSRYSDSVKAQQQLPKKVYFIDHVLAQTLGFRTSDDSGRMLENVVFLELKRNYN